MRDGKNLGLHPGRWFAPGFEPQFHHELTVKVILDHEFVILKALGVQEVTHTLPRLGVAHDNDFI